MTSRCSLRRRAVPFLAAAALLAACTDTAGDDDTVAVVATFSILGDMTEQIGGERVQVHSIVPLGQDPHEYTPRPDDLQQASDASVLVWNGLNMETGDNWFADLAEVSGHDLGDDTVVEASDGIEPMLLDDDPGGGDDRINPHAFLDPVLGAQYALNIRDGLIAANPAGEPYYTARTEDYLAELAGLDARYADTVAALPEDRRILVTSENAFQYMAARYGLTPGYLWAIDTEGQGTPDQISALIDLVRDDRVPALFVESNVDTRPMQTVSDETGVPIAGVIYSDALGEPGAEGASYLGMLESNLTLIEAGLGA